MDTRKRSIVKAITEAESIISKQSNGSIKIITPIEMMTQTLSRDRYKQLMEYLDKYYANQTD